MRVQIRNIMAILFLAVYPMLMSAEDTVRRVRAAWIETAGGRDWPQGRVDAATQRRHMSSLLEQLVDRGINSVIVQVQGQGDVAWDSTEQPRMAELAAADAEYNGYDAARAWLEECHRRGLGCIARVTTLDIGTGRAAARYADTRNHPLVTHPGLSVNYQGSWYLDPGDPGTADYLMDVYRDLIYDYDFDGIMFDKLYYPGPDFDDSATQRAYKSDGKTVAEWRRDNTEDCIDRLSQMVRIIRPQMTVYAVAPGIYRVPEEYELPTAYDDYGQDAPEWAAAGYIDVIVPQMFHGEREGFDDNMDTWVANARGARLLPALDPMSAGNTGQLMRRMDAVSAAPENIVDGVSIYGASEVVRDDVTRVLDIVFAGAAHLPVNPHGDGIAPDGPTGVTQEYTDGKYVIGWKPVEPLDGEPPIRYYTVYIMDSDDNPHEVIHATVDTHVELPSGDPGKRYAVSATNRDNMMSRRMEAERADGDTSRFDIQFAYQGGIAYITSATDIRRIDVHTLMGRNVLSRKLSGTHASIDFNGFERGIYVIRVLRDGRDTALFKVVI